MEVKHCRGDAAEQKVVDTDLFMETNFERRNDSIDLHFRMQ